MHVYNKLPLEQGQLTARGYKMVYRHLYWRVVPEGTKRECDELATVEWRAEANGADHMPPAAFARAMHTFVDTWCARPGKAAYLKFASDLLLPLVSPDRYTSEFSAFALSGARAPREGVGAPDDGSVEEVVLGSCARRAEWEAARTPLAEVYALECRRLHVECNPRVAAALPGGAGLRVLRLNRLGLSNVKPLLDVLNMSRNLEVSSLCPLTRIVAAR